MLLIFLHKKDNKNDFVLNNNIIKNFFFIVSMYKNIWGK